MIIECTFVSLGQTYHYRVPLMHVRFADANEWFAQQGSSGACDSWEWYERRTSPEILGSIELVTWVSQKCAFFKNYEEAFAFVMRFG